MRNILTTIFLGVLLLLILLVSENFGIANERLHSKLQESILPSDVTILRSDTKSIIYAQSGGLYKLQLNPITKYELLPKGVMLDVYLVEDGVVYLSSDNDYKTYSFEDQSSSVYINASVTELIKQNSNNTPLPITCNTALCKDTDGDGFTDYEEKGANTNRWDANSYPLVARSGIDSDDDGIDDVFDNCISKPNTKQENLDRDSMGNACDDDIDGDGYSNDVEAEAGTNRWDPLDYPDNSSPQTNLDSDGDGYIDSEDNCPTVVNTTQWDNDLDGIGNLCDTDIDGDGYSNIDEDTAKSDKWSEDSTPVNINGYVPPEDCNS